MRTLLITSVLWTALCCKAPAQDVVLTSGTKAAKERHEFREGHRDGLGVKPRSPGSLFDHILQNEKLAADLQLTDEQKAALKKAWEELRRVQEEMATRQEEEGIFQARLLMEGGEVDEDKLMEAVERAGKARIEVAKARVRAMLTVRKTLSPAQIEKIRQIMKERLAAGAEKDARRALLRERLEKWRSLGEKDHESHDRGESKK